MNMCDLVVHLDEDLEQGQMQELEALICEREGVISAHFSRKHPHLMTVAFDCDATHGQDIVRQFVNKGLRAQAVGM